MNELKGHTVVVDAAALNSVIQTARLVQYPDLISIQSIAALTNALEWKLREVQAENQLKVGAIVMPKTGCNFLRAGTTAYGHAIVIWSTPLMVASSDGLHVWMEQMPSNYNVIGQAYDNTLHGLQETWLRKVTVNEQQRYSI